MIILINNNDNIKIFISKNNKILYNGYFTLIKSFKILIDKVDIRKKRNKVKINEKELLKILKEDNIIITHENTILTSFLKQEKIKYTLKYICENCIDFKRINILSNKTMYSLNDRYYCINCSRNMLRYKETSGYYYDYEYYDFLLDKSNDLNKILDILENKNNILNYQELTLYDTLAQTEEEYRKISPETLNLPKEFKKIISEKIEYLYPIQNLAIKKGLLKNQNLLVVSATASGKTLIGELAGIPKALKHKKMIYLSPLVALANQKYRDLKRDYEKLGLKIAIKVGQNRVNAEDELVIAEESIKDADIIVATYEALDYILRSGDKDHLKNLGTVIIDEVQMLEDEDRGHRLNGLINRLLTLFSHAQFIALSATIKNSNKVASNFNMKLVSYDKRPVKIDRHIVPLFKKERNDFIVNLCKKEYEKISSKNYHGQTIIFTDSRRKTNDISNFLKKKGVSSVSYHAGLTYKDKLEIEEAYLNQEISTIVTTSALASGIDFPASLVIFESIRMGFDWISPNQFHQMLGRAGRPTYHDKGQIYLLPYMDNYYYSDYTIAYDLLKSDVENINVLFSTEDVYEQVLSDICAIGNTDINSLKKKYDKLLLPITFNEAIEELLAYKMIKCKGKNKRATATNYGRAVSKSFISIKTAEFIKNNLSHDVINTAISIEKIKNVYITKKIINKLEKRTYKKIPIRLFSDYNRESYYNGILLRNADKSLKNKIINTVNDFFNCDCNYSPYCDCLEKNISYHIINRRIQGWTPSQISKEFNREYELKIYSGDIYSYLDQTIKVLDSIKRIAKVNHIENTYKDCKKIIKKIEG